MIFPLLLSILLSLSTGLLLACLLWPARTQFKWCWLMKLSVAVGLGLGLSSEIHFLWLWIPRRSMRGLVLTDLELLGSLAGALFYFKILSPKRRAQTPTRYVRAEPIQWVSMQWALAAAFCAALVAAIYAFLSSFYNHPHGQWDAWMAWNLRARFFFRAGEHWRDAFSGLFLGANPEYPVLLPSTVARSWQYAGQEMELAPVLVAALFTFASVALTYSSLCVLRSKGQGLLAGLLLVGTPFFVQHGTSQYADVPLGFFLLASIVLLCMRDRISGQTGGLLLLAGMAAGFAAWTKNEGLLFVVALTLVTAAVLVAKDGIRAYAAHQLALTAGLLVVLPIVLYFKLYVAPPDPMLIWERSTLHKVIEWQRYWQILKAFGHESLWFGNWPVEVTPLLAFYALLLGINLPQSKKRSTIISVGTLGLTLVGYLCVYLISSDELARHLRSSLQRLVLQLWPSALFLFFLLVRTPEEALSEDSGNLSGQGEDDGWHKKPRLLDLRPPGPR
jgi:hypothetical protein